MGEFIIPCFLFRIWLLYCSSLQLDRPARTIYNSGRIVPLMGAGGAQGPAGAGFVLKASSYESERAFVKRGSRWSSAGRDGGLQAPEPESALGSKQAGALEVRDSLYY